MSPETKSIGNSATTTVNVATMVGLPTSATAEMAAESVVCPARLPAQWRAMFSIITIASSTRMPIEKISANSETRFSV